jgi:hypothetical protein
MKKISLTLFFVGAVKMLIAQDVCAEMMRFNDYKKNVNRTYRVETNTELLGQKQIMEKDAAGNVRMTMTMQGTTTESIVMGNMMYIKRGEGNWDARELDSAQMDMVKTQWQNGTLQFFKNCEKLPDTTINSKKYRAYAGNMDMKKTIEMMGAAGKDIPNKEMMEMMEMRMQLYINDKNDLEKSKMTTSVMGQSFDSEMTYTYDIDINIIPPPPPPPAPAEKKKN